MATLKRSFVAFVATAALMLTLTGPAATAVPTWYEVEMHGCNGHQYTNSNRISGTQNLSSEIDGWEYTFWNNSTRIRTVTANKSTGGYYLHKRGISLVGVFVYSGSYAYCR